MKTALLTFACLALLLGAAAAKARSDGGRIINSGSTNSPGYEITIWSDGRAKVTAGGSSRSARTSHAVKFFADAKAAKGSAGAPAHCMKSASFGSTTRVLYHGWTSPDLLCPAEGALGALADDAATIAAELHAGAGGRRIHLPVNEPRRLPGPSAPLATPSPSSRS